jgi:hypothetical protein
MHWVRSVSTVTNPSPVVFCGLAALLLGCQVAGHAASGPLVVGKAPSRNAGIVVATLKASRTARSIGALGVVLDPAPLIRLSGNLATLKAQVDGAKAKVVLERHQMSQASALYKRHTTSLAKYQKAAEDLATSQARFTVARAKRATQLSATEATWGTVMVGILRDDGAPLPQLVAGKAMLVGLSLPPGITLKSPPRRAEAEAAGTRFPIRLIGSVPRRLGRYPGQSFLYWAAAQPGVPVGTTVSATLPVGPQRKGVRVPGSAVLWQDGHALVFRAVKDDRYQPLRIATNAPRGSGYFIARKLHPGDGVVVHGGDALLGLLEHARAHPHHD